VNPAQRSQGILFLSGLLKPEGTMSMLIPARDLITEISSNWAMKITTPKSFTVKQAA
jgi:hypothetical protein